LAYSDGPTIVSLTRSPNPRLISKHWKCCLTVTMYV